ncbi:unnamed protein product [Prorocentrum cordatum]|uniref:Steroid 5-alpha reductase C-terminal domain-containing protein n=1 Tax=Prorocentrum cordatum TaxID=2364126 RepID=A0ABN9TI19_9DINO|nr:unnamed protein product [Polarella glacialis]
MAGQAGLAGALLDADGPSGSAPRGGCGAGPAGHHEAERACCGQLDCGALVSWRGQGGSRSWWQLACTACLLVECGVLYLHQVRDSDWLLSVGALWLCKLLVEIWGQTTPTWVCPGGPLTFVVVYVFGVPGILYYYSFCRRNNDIVFEGSETLGFVMFVGGSAYSLHYELERFAWKMDGRNKGRLHTHALARYCRHPNYFGDLFTYTGWGVLAGTTCAVSVPLFTVWTFIYFVIPNSDAYLSSRYQSEWPEYAERTPILFPFLRSSVANKLLAWMCLVISLRFSLNCTGQCSSGPA